MTLASACFIPPGDNFFQNRPPRIRRDLVSPQPALIRIGDSSACQSLTFSVRVEDPDLEDEIRFNWFVDDRPDAGTEYLVAGGSIGNAPQLRPLRESPIVWRATPRAQSSRLFARQSHLVEVVIADGNLGERSPRTPESRQKNRQSPPEETYSDSFAWTVVIETDLTCGP